MDKEYLIIIMLVVGSFIVGMLTEFSACKLKNSDFYKDKYIQEYEYRIILEKQLRELKLDLIEINHPSREEN